MGNQSSSEIKQILIIGLDNSGKTTLINSFINAHNEKEKQQFQQSQTSPTMGFNYQIVKEEINKVKYQVGLWDVGGKSTIRSLWSSYYKKVKMEIVIFVINAEDQERILEARDELHILMQEEELRNAVLILAFNSHNYDEKFIIQKISLIKQYCNSEMYQKQIGIYQLEAQSQGKILDLSQFQSINTENRADQNDQLRITLNQEKEQSSIGLDLLQLEQNRKSKGMINSLEIPPQLLLKKYKTINEEKLQQQQQFETFGELERLQRIKIKLSQKISQKIQDNKALGSKSIQEQLNDIEEQILKQINEQIDQKQNSFNQQKIKILEEKINIQQLDQSRIYHSILFNFKLFNQFNNNKREQIKKWIFDYQNS